MTVLSCYVTLQQCVSTIQHAVIKPMTVGLTLDLLTSRYDLTIYCVQWVNASHQTRLHSTVHGSSLELVVTSSCDTEGFRVHFRMRGFIRALPRSLIIGWKVYPVLSGCQWWSNTEQFMSLTKFNNFFKLRTENE